MAVAIPPAKAGLTEAVVPVVAVQVGDAQPMDALVADAPEVPAQGVVPVLSVGDDLIRTAASIAMVLPAGRAAFPVTIALSAVSYTHLRAHETRGNLVCRLLLEKKK